MSNEAADQLAEASGGYPYAIQLMGHHAWRASTGSDTIGPAHAGPAIAAAQDELATGLYASRWQDASDQEQDYLRHLAALAANHSRVTGAMVAEASDSTPKALSSPRSRLIQKGLIYAEGETVRFAIPGMADWVRVNAPEEE